MRKRIFITLLTVSLFFIASILLRPLLVPGFPETDDGTWMIIRLTAFYQALVDGQFPVRFLGRLNNHYGYPVANFLYPGFLYIGTFFHGLGLTFVDSIKLIMAGSVLIGAGAAYYWLRAFFPIPGSLIGTMMFLLNPYISYDLFVRGSVGELLAIAMAQVTIMAIERNIKLLIPLSFALLLISHNTLAVFFVAFIMFYVYIRRKIQYIAPLCIGGLMTVFFWIPVFFEKSLVFFDAVTVSKPSSYVGITLQLLLESAPFLILSVFVFFKNRYVRHLATYLFIILCVLVVLTTPFGKGIWNTTVFHQFVQFPFRLFAFFPFFAAFFTAYVASSGSKTIRKICVVLAVTASVLFFFSRIKNVSSKIIPESLYMTNEATTTVQDEFMPRWVTEKSKSRADVRVEIVSGDADIDIDRYSTKYLKAVVTAQSKSILRINTVYYPGWNARVDGEKTPIVFDNPQGLMEIPISTGSHTVEIEFKETPLRFIADGVTGVGVILYVVYCVRVWPKKKKGKRARVKKTV